MAAGCGSESASSTMVGFPFPTTKREYHERTPNRTYARPASRTLHKFEFFYRCLERIDCLTLLAIQGPKIDLFVSRSYAGTLSPPQVGFFSGLRVSMCERFNDSCQVGVCTVVGLFVAFGHQSETARNSSFNICSFSAGKRNDPFRHTSFPRTRPFDSREPS